MCLSVRHHNSRFMLNVESRKSEWEMSPCHKHNRHMHFATNESMRICWFSLFTCWCLLTVSADTLMALKHRFSQTKVLHEMPGRGDVFPAKYSMSESSEQIRPMPWNVVELCSQWCWVAKGMGRGEKMRHISLAGKLIFVLIKGLYRGANNF